MEEKTRTAKLLPGLGLALSAMVLGLFAGGLVGRLTVPKTEGLAGAVEVLAYALFGGLLLLVSAVVLVWRSPRGISIRLLIFSGPLAVILLSYATWSFMKNKAEKDRQWEEEQRRYREMKPTAPAAPVMFAAWSTAGTAAATRPPEQGPQRLGLGMAAPVMETGVFHFYAGPDMDRIPDPSQALDSLIFEKGKHYIGIASAPPWFVPAHMKLDYGLLLLKVITLSRNWVEVEVNTFDGATRWVDRQELGIALWPEFISTVNSVEIIDPETNPIRIKPLDHASIMADGADALLKPLAVQGDWLMVDTSGLADRIAPTGWIRWRDGERLLVRYNLLC
ncbi:MAG TPA: hypothetical protein PLS92_02570 [Flavobacteriales bacterium]|nr:hypothetical protein [Flavobacteriales bacterium]QQS72755.1 MAG: hypothetical protein IPP95_00515 [Flavobacteriales bacterium]HQV38146.1 hypothetical protein [Flavobacteriales bacterium]HQW31280.1 hypothetical protein [Flavobacteriales bacterium]HQY01910.1 hypothetical protein [Flavobacteriales bacterium]